MILAYENQKTNKLKAKYLIQFKKYLVDFPNRATFSFLVSNRKREGTGYMYIPSSPKISRLS